MKSESHTFHVTRRSPELIPPARLTPNDLKLLSSMDQLPIVRTQVPNIQFYQRSELALKQGNDPVSVIRKAIAEALVYYYPLAGRFRETKNEVKKLIVDCTGEGILFIEADADVSLLEFGEVIYPCKSDLNELLFDEHGFSEIFNRPLLLVQVTRLACGGFVMAIRYSHVMCDGFGLTQFLTAVSEFARGFLVPSVYPIWQRHLVSTEDVSRINFMHPKFDKMSIYATTPKIKVNMIERPFIFNINTLRLFCQRISPACYKYSTFDLIAAIIWRCRTISFKFDPSDEVCLVCVVDSRRKFNPPIPLGYYGNVTSVPRAVTTAGQLKTNSIEYACELIKNAKNKVNEDYMQSINDLSDLNDQPQFALGTFFIISDLRKLGLHEIDFGWGKAELGGSPRWTGEAHSVGCNITSIKGDTCCIVTMCLPDLVMDMFVNELHHMMEILNVRASL